jgi:hypothetical protein
MHMCCMQIKIYLAFLLSANCTPATANRLLASQTLFESRAPALKLRRKRKLTLSGGS